MQTLTEKIWMLKPPDGLFTQTTLQNEFQDLSTGAIKLSINRALKKNEIIRLKPGFYCLSEKYRSSNPHPFVVSGMLLSPSYVSMESALWHHGLIPEALYQTSCGTSLRTREYKNKLGLFSYYKIACNNLKAGAKSMKIGNRWAFLATPLRAIADMVYLNKKISWETHGIDYLTESLRIELKLLSEISLKSYNEIYNNFTNNRVKGYLLGVRKVLKNV